MVWLGAVAAVPAPTIPRVPVVAMPALFVPALFVPVVLVPVVPGFARRAAPMPVRDVPKPHR